MRQHKYYSFDRKEQVNCTTNIAKCMFKNGVYHCLSSFNHKNIKQRHMTINLLTRRSAMAPMAFCAEKLFAIPPFQRLQRKVSLFFLEFLKCRLRQRLRKMEDGTDGRQPIWTQRDAAVEKRWFLVVWNTRLFLGYTYNMKTCGICYNML